MSETIDNKRIEMTFDNEQFEKDIHQTMVSLDELNRKVDALSSNSGTKMYNGMSKQLNTMAKGFADVGKAADAVTKKISTLGTFTDQIFRNISSRLENFAHQSINKIFVAPLKGGFDEYEEKMGSIQTIMAGTGESLQNVNKALDELNHYSDQTIYSFRDMTNNIGKFTNAGVKLQPAVDAIKGIANEAALSGANAQQASHAMYNFSQALSSGTIKLIDWKSIQNAQMDTMEFKNTLIETAAAMGTLKKSEKGYISTTKDAQGNVSDLFNAQSKFNDSLSANWLTKDVLTNALKLYATDIREFGGDTQKLLEYENSLKKIGFTDEQIKKFEDIGKRAADAAKDVKTFTMMLDTLNEAIGSGWAKSSELIFGNLDEAKALWTGLSNIIGGVIDKIDTWRNNLVEAWRDTKTVIDGEELGGREVLLQSLINVLNAISAAIWPIKKAFQEVFGTIGGEDLAGATSGLEGFTRSLIMTADKMMAVKDNLVIVFSAVKKGLDTLLSYRKPIIQFLLIVTVIKSIKSIFSGGLGLGTILNILKAIVALNIFKNLSGLNSRTFSLDKLIKNITGTLTDLQRKAKNLMTTIGNSKAFNTIVTVLKSIVKIVAGLVVLAAAGIAKLISLIKQIPFKTIISGIGTVFNAVKNFFAFLYQKISGSKVAEALSKIKSESSGVGDFLKRLATTVLGVIIGGVTTAKNAVVEGITWLVKKVTGIQLPKINLPKPDFSKVADWFENIKEKSANLGEFIKNLLSELWALIKDFAGKVGEEFSSLLSRSTGIGSFIKNAFDDLKTAITGIKPVDISDAIQFNGDANKIKLPDFSKFTGALKSVTSGVKSASMGTLFGAMAKDADNANEKVNTFGNAIKRFFSTDGIFKGLIIGGVHAAEVGEDFDKADSKVEKVSNNITNNTARMATVTAASMQTVGNQAATTGNGIEAIGIAVHDFFARIENDLENAETQFPVIMNAVKFMLKIDWNKVFGIVALVLVIHHIKLLKKGVDGLNTTIKNISASFETLRNAATGMLNSIGGSFTTVAGAISGYFKSLTNLNKGKIFKDIAVGVALLTASLLALALVPLDPNRLIGAAVAIGIMGAAVGAFTAVVGKAAAGLGENGAKNLYAIMAVLVTFAGIIAEMSIIVGISTAVVTALTKNLRTWQDVVVAIVRLAAPIGMLFSFFGAMINIIEVLTPRIMALQPSISTIAITMAKMAGGIAALSGAILLFNIAIWALIANLQLLGVYLNKIGDDLLYFLKYATDDKMASALLGIGSGIVVLIGIIGLFKLAADNLSKGAIKAAAGIVALSGSLLMLSATISILGNIDYKKMWQGFGGMALSLAVLIGAMEVLFKLGRKGAKGTTYMTGVAKTMKTLGSAMLKMAASVLILTGAVLILGSIPWQVMVRGLVAVFGMLMSLALAMKIMNKVGVEKITAALLSFAVSIYLLIPAIVILGLMAPLAAKGIALLAGLMLSLAGSIKLMSGVDGKNVIPTIAAMTIAAGFLTDFCKQLAEIPDMKKAIAAAGMLSGIMLAFGGAIAIASKAVASMKDTKGLNSKLIAIVAMIGVMGYSMKMIGDSMAAMSQNDWTSIAASGAAMVASMIAMAKSITAIVNAFATIGTAKGVDRYLKAALPTIALVAAAAVAIGATISVMAGNDWTSLAAASGGMVLAILAFGHAVTSIAEAFSGIQSYNWQGMAATVTLMAGAVFVIGSVIGKMATNQDWASIIAASAGMSLAMVAFAGAVAIIGLVFGNIQSYDWAGMIVTVGLMSVATVVLGQVISQLAGLPVENLKAAVDGISQALIVFSACIAGLTVISSLFKSADFLGMSVMMIALGGGIAIMAAGLSTLEKVPIGNIIASIVSFTASLAGLMIVSKFIHAGDMLEIAGAALALGAAIGVMALGLSTLANVPMGNIIATIVSFSASLAGLMLIAGLLPQCGIALIAVGNAALKMGIGIGVAAAGLSLLNLSMQHMLPVLQTFVISMMNIDAEHLGNIGNNLVTMAKGTVALGGAMIVFAGGLALVSLAASYAGKVMVGLAEAGAQVLTLLENAGEWGHELAEHLAGGLESGIDLVSNAAKGIANAIASFLHFTVPPEEPLNSVPSWMPHLGNFLIDGLTNLIGPVGEASKGVAGAIADPLKGVTEGDGINLTGMTDKAKKELNDTYTEFKKAYDDFNNYLSSHKGATAETDTVLADLQGKLDEAREAVEKTGATVKDTGEIVDKEGKQIEFSVNNTAEGIKYTVKDTAKATTDAAKDATEKTTGITLEGVEEIIDQVLKGEISIPDAFGEIAEKGGQNFLDKLNGLGIGTKSLEDIMSGAGSKEGVWNALMSALGFEGGSALGSAAYNAAMPYIDALMNLLKIANDATQSLETRQKAGAQMESVMRSQGVVTTQKEMNEFAKGPEKYLKALQKARQEAELARNQFSLEDLLPNGDNPFSGGGGGGGDLGAGTDDDKKKSKGSGSKSTKDASKALQDFQKNLEKFNERATPIINRFAESFGAMMSEVSNTTPYTLAGHGFELLLTEIYKVSDKADETFEDSETKGTALQQRADAIRKAFTEAFDKITESVRSSLDFFEEFDRKTSDLLEGDKILSNARSQVDALNDVSAAMERLAYRGLSDTMIQTLGSDPLKNFDKIMELDRMTDEQLQQFDKISNEEEAMAQNYSIILMGARMVALELEDMGVKGIKSYDDLDTASQAYVDLQEELNEVQKKNIDLTKTVYGNVDTNARQILQWTDESLKKYDEALKSWNITDLNVGDYSTVEGMSDEFGGIEIAFTPILDTDDGPIFMDKNTVSEYVNGVMEAAQEAANKGDGDLASNILAIDKTGLDEFEVEGHKIQGIIAGIGDEAIKAGESMHFAGNVGSIAFETAKLQKEADKLGISVDDLKKKMASTIDVSAITKASILKDLRSLYSKLSEANTVIQKVEDKATAFASTVADAISGFGNAFEDFDLDTEKSADGLVNNLRKRLSAVRLMQTSIAALQRRGLNQDAIASLVEQGQDSLVAALKFTPDQIKEINSTFPDYAEELKVTEAEKEKIKQSYISTAKANDEAYANALKESKETKKAIEDKTEEYSKNFGNLSAKEMDKQAEKVSDKAVQDVTATYEDINTKSSVEVKGTVKDTTKTATKEIKTNGKDIEKAAEEVAENVIKTANKVADTKNLSVDTGAYDEYLDKLKAQAMGHLNISDSMYKEASAHVNLMARVIAGQASNEELVVSQNHLTESCKQAGIAYDDLMKSMTTTGAMTAQVALVMLQSADKMETAYNQAQEAYTNSSLKVQKFENQIAAFGEAVKSAMDNVGDLFSEYNESFDVTGDSMVKNVKMRMTAVKMFVEDIKELMTKDLDPKLMQTLISKGPEYVAAALTLSDSDLKEIDDSYKEYTQLSENVQEEASKNFKETARINGESYQQALDEQMNDKETLQKICDDFNNQMKEILTALAAETGTETAVTAQNATAEAVNAGSEAVDAASTAAGQNIDNKIAEGVVTNQPTVTAATTAVGVSGGNALAAGVQSTQTTVEGAATTVANAATNAVQTQGVDKADGLGTNFTYGFANGVANGEAVQAVINAATSMVGSAVSAAQKKADEHSPSKVAAKLGSFFTEGFAIGIGNNEAVAKVTKASTLIAGIPDAVVREVNEIHSPSMTAQDSAKWYIYGLCKGLTDHVTELQDASKKAAESIGKTINESLEYYSKKTLSGMDDAIAAAKDKVLKAREAEKDANATYKQKKEVYESAKEDTDAREKEYNDANKQYEKATETYLERKTRIQAEVKEAEKHLAKDNIGDEDTKRFKKQVEEGTKELEALETSDRKRLADLEKDIAKKTKEKEQLEKDRDNELKPIERDIDRKQDESDDYDKRISAKKEEWQQAMEDGDRAKARSLRKDIMDLNEEKTSVEKEITKLNNQKDDISSKHKPNITAIEDEIDAEQDEADAIQDTIDKSAEEEKQKKDEAEASYSASKTISDGYKDEMDAAKDAADQKKEDREEAEKYYKRVKGYSDTYKKYAKNATSVVSKFARSVGGAFGVIGNVNPIEHASNVFTNMIAQFVDFEEIASDLEDEFDGEDVPVEAWAEKIQAAFNEVFEDVKSNINDSINLFEEFDRKLDNTLSPDKLLANAKSQLEGNNEFYSMIESLAYRVPESLRDKLYDLAKGGVGNIAEVRGMYQMTDAQLQELGNTYSEITSKEEDWAATVFQPKMFDTVEKMLKENIGLIKDDIPDAISAAESIVRSADPKIVGYINDALDGTEAFTKALDGSSDKIEFNLEAYKKAMDNLPDDVRESFVLPDEVFDKYDELQDAIKEATEAGADLSKTVYGNIDMNNRQRLDWTEELTKQYADALKSWNQNPEDLVGNWSTVMGASTEYEGLEIAFSPMLQTDHGPVLLSRDTVDNYMLALINQLNSEHPEGWTTEQLFELDTQGIDYQGKHIKNLIADIGDTAEATAEQMHFVGTDSDYGVLSKYFEDLASKIGITKDELLELTNTQEGRIDSIAESFSNVQNAVSATAEAIDDATNNVNDSADAINNLSKDYTKEAKKVQKADKAESEFASTMKEVGDAANKTTDAIELQGETIDGTTGSMAGSEKQFEESKKKLDEISKSESANVSNTKKVSDAYIKLTDYCKKNNINLKDLQKTLASKDTLKFVDNMKSVSSQLSKSKAKVEEFTSAAKQMASDMSDAVANAFSSPFQKIEQQSEEDMVTGSQLIDYLQGNVTAANNLMLNINDLIQNGVDLDVVRALVSQGSEYVQAATTWSDTEVKRANELYKQGKDLKDQASDWVTDSVLQNLEINGQKYADALKQWNEDNEVYKSFADQFVTGLTEKLGSSDMAKRITDWLMKSSEEAAKEAKSNDEGLNEEGYNLGSGVASSFGKGITDKTDEARQAANDFSLKTMDTMRANANEKEGANIAYNVVQGMCNGLTSSESIAALQSSAGYASSVVTSTIQSELGIHSPSRVAMELGDYFNQGLAIGLSNTDDIESTSAQMASEMLSTIHNALTLANSILSGEQGFTPTITPIVDMSNVSYAQNAIGAMSSELSGLALNPNIGAIYTPNSMAQMAAMQHDTYDDTRVVMAINSLDSRIDNLGRNMEQMRVILDTGTLVGELAPGINQQLGQMYRRQSRQ